MIYTIRAAFQLKKSSYDEDAKKEFWQAGKSVAGIEQIESARDIINRFKQALLNSKRDLCASQVMSKNE